MSSILDSVIPSPSNIKPKTKSLEVVSIVGILVFIILVSLGIAYSLFSNHSHSKSSNLVSVTNTLIPLSPTIIKETTPIAETVKINSVITPFSPNNQLLVLPNIKNKVLTDIFKKDLSTDEQTLLLTTDNVYKDNYNFAEYISGNTYVIKRIGSTSNSNWTDELWKYDSSGNGMKIYSVKGLDFRVNSLDSLIAVGPNTKTSDSNIEIINSSGASQKTFTKQQLKGTKSGLENQTVWEDTPALNLIGWSDDGINLWGNIGYGSQTTVYCKINTSDYSVKSYDVGDKTFYLTGQSLKENVALNLNTGKVAYSDYPQVLSSNGKDAQKSYTLKIYDLVNKRDTTVSTQIGDKFNPLWLDNKTLEYLDTSVNKRVTYIIN